MGCLSLAGLGYLIIEVNKLDQEFGALIRDKAGYTERLDQVKKEVEFAEKAQNTAWAEKNTINFEIQKQKSEATSLKNEIAKLQSDYQTTKNNLESLESELLSGRDALKSAEEKIGEAKRLEVLIDNRRAENKKLLSDQAKLLQENDDLKKSIDKNNSEKQVTLNGLEILFSEVDLEEKTRDSLKDEIENYESQRAEKEQELVEITAKIDQANADLKNIFKEKNENESLIASQKTEIEKNRVALTVSDNNLLAEQVKVNDERLALEDFKSQVDALRDTINNLEEKLLVKKQEYDVKSAEVSQKQIELKSLNEALSNAGKTQADIDALELRRQELQQRFNNLESSIAILKSDESNLNSAIQNLEGKLGVKKAEVQKLENDETELNMKIISLEENVNAQQKTIDLLEKEKAIKENDLKFLQTQIKLQRENMNLKISDGNDDISEALDAELDVDQQE